MIELLKCLSFFTDVNKENFYWNNQNTKLLLHLFQERKEKFKDPKVKKKPLWTEIANEFRKHNYACVTEDILDRKMKNMKKTYRIIKDNQKLSGQGRITWEYFETFENIFFDDKTMNIGPTLSSMQCTSQPVRKYTNIRNFSNAKYFEIFLCELENFQNLY